MIRHAIDVGYVVLVLGRYNNMYFNYTKLTRVLYEANCLYARSTGNFLFAEKNKGNMNCPRYDSVMDAYGAFISCYITTDIPVMEVPLSPMQIMAIRKAMNLEPYDPFKAIEMGEVNKDTAKYI